MKQWVGDEEWFDPPPPANHNRIYWIPLLLFVLIIFAGSIAR